MRHDLGTRQSARFGDEVLDTGAIASCHYADGQWGGNCRNKTAERSDLKLINFDGDGGTVRAVHPNGDWRSPAKLLMSRSTMSRATRRM